MATLAELIADVYTITNRSDLVAETTLAVKSATLKAHRLDFFSKDLYETAFEFSEVSYTQTLDYITQVPNFRSLSYIRFYFDPINITPTTVDATNGFAEIITPQEILDSYGYNRTNIAYVAGRTIEIRAAESFDKILLGAYVLPIVTPDIEFSSWVASLYPYVIVYEAARQVLALIGKVEESNRYRQLVAEEYDSFTRTSLADQAF